MASPALLSTTFGELGLLSTSQRRSRQTAFLPEWDCWVPGWSKQWHTVSICLVCIKVRHLARFGNFTSLTYFGVGLLHAVCSALVVAADVITALPEGFLNCVKYVGRQWPHTPSRVPCSPAHWPSRCNTILFSNPANGLPGETGRVLS